MDATTAEALVAVLELIRPGATVGDFDAAARRCVAESDMAQAGTTKFSAAEVDRLGDALAGWIRTGREGSPRRVVLDQKHLLIGRDVDLGRVAQFEAQEILFYYFSIRHDPGLAPAGRVERLEETLFSLCLYYVGLIHNQDKCFRISLVRDFVRILGREGRLNPGGEALAQERVIRLLAEIEEPWALTLHG